MMEETGTVVELKPNNIAVVLCEKHSTCAHCEAKGACSVGSDKSSRVVDTHNHAGAEVGDVVKLETDTDKFMKSTFVLYGVPLVFLFAGALFGKWMAEVNGADPEGWSALFGLGSLVLSFFFLRLITGGVNKEKYMPKLTRVLHKHGEIG